METSTPRKTSRDLRLQPLHHQAEGVLEYGGLADAEPQHAFPKHKPEPWKYTRRLIDAFPKHKVSELRKEFPTKQEFSWKSFHLQSSESSWTVYKRRLELHVLSR